MASRSSEKEAPSLTSEGEGDEESAADEDDDEQQDAEEPSTSAAGQHASPPASSEGKQSTQNGSDNGKVQPRLRSRSQPHRRDHGPRTKRARVMSRDQTRSRSPLRSSPKPDHSATSWKTETDPDVCLVPKRFIPARPPGHQLNSSTTFTPLDLFKLFFSNRAAQTICRNTNTQAAKNIARGKKYSWTNINTKEFFKYVGLNFFFALVKLDNIQDYWKKNTIFSVPFPASVMPRDMFRTISWSIHMSDPKKDIENRRKRGTPDHDPLFPLKPLLDTIRDACKAFYHPRQNLAIDKRMVATKGHAGMQQHMKVKPQPVKLFVLADSSNGYTWDFAVYTAKSQIASGGLAYDAVMSLIKPAYLGSGFHLYVDSFYTSPKLFKDLFTMEIGACGAYKDKRSDSPRSNALAKKDPRGSMRWIREDSLLFVKWKDTRQISVCSTIHEASSGGNVQRRVKTQDGDWTTKSIPCPSPVMEYNKHMGGVYLSDQLIQYYSVQHKSARWHRTLFFHFLDIAATNSFLLHKELCKEKKEEPMGHRAFLQELTAQLCGVPVTIPPAKGHSGHLPVAISEQHDVSKKATYGRRTCVHCRQTKQVRHSTPWKCMECDVALCVIPDRNCFKAWHS